MSPRDRAIALIRAGISPIPVPAREKKPNLAQWQNLRVTEANVEQYFNGKDQNIGGLLGEPSNGLIDIDLDCEEAIKLAPAFLPPTATFGRASSKRSHWLFRVTDEIPKTLKFTDPSSSAGERNMMLELRSTGHQTILPGSVHPSGEQIKWTNRKHDPAAITQAELVRRIRHLAAAVLLLRHWTPGSRDEVAKNLIGSLLRADWSPDDANQFVAAVASAADDEDLALRLKAERMQGWDNLPGLPALRGVLDPKVAERLADWLDLQPSAIDPDRLIHELNSRHATIWDGNKLRILHESYDPHLRRNEVALVDPFHLKTLYENQPRIPTADSRKPLNQIDWWMKHSQRRHCKGFVLDPGLNDPDVFNLWEGFAVTPDPAGDCDLFLDHMRSNIANGVPEVFEYLLDWMADAVQNPTIRPGIAVVLRGGQGAGKGVFIRTFGHLFGRHFVHVQSADHFLGRFNKHLQYALLLFADEAVWAGDKRAEGKLKGLITEADLTVEGKFENARSMPNNIRVMIASNHDWVVPAGLDERRMFVLDVGDGRAQDSDYFGAALKQLKAGGYGKLLHLLQTRDLSSVNIRKFPATTALLEQKIATMEAEIRFIFECAKTASLPGNMEDVEKGLVPRQMLHKAYLEYARNLGKQYRLGEAQFGSALHKLLPDLKDVRPRDNGVRVRCYQFPSLPDVREALERQLRQKVVWDDVSEWMYQEDEMYDF